MMTRRSLLFGLAAGGTVLGSRVSAAAARTFVGGEHQYPIRMRKKIEILYKSPEGHPNALDATPEGLWVGEQVSDRAHLLDWETGKSLTAYDTQSSNTSGLAYGGGFLWMAANGPGRMRDKRPHDVERGRGQIVKIDAKTGQHVKSYSTPNGKGLHGLAWHDDSLWIAQSRPGKIVQSGADLNVKSSFALPLGRPHGLGWDGNGIWNVFSNDFRVLKFDPVSGQVIEAIQLNSDDPNPHGMTCYQGSLYYCDAGIGPGNADKSKFAGSICRIEL